MADRDPPRVAGGAHDDALQAELAAGRANLEAKQKLHAAQLDLEINQKEANDARESLIRCRETRPACPAEEQAVAAADARPWVTSAPHTSGPSSTLRNAKLPGGHAEDGKGSPTCTQRSAPNMLEDWLVEKGAAAAAMRATLPGGARLLRQWSLIDIYGDRAPSAGAPSRCPARPPR